MAPLLATAATILAAWLLTYAMHSTVLLGSAWLLTRLRALRAPETRDMLWKTAILGGLITTTLHLTLLTGPQLMTIAQSDFVLPEILTEDATPLFPQHATGSSVLAPEVIEEMPDTTAFGEQSRADFGERFGPDLSERFGGEFSAAYEARQSAAHDARLAETAPVEITEKGGFWQRGFSSAEAVVGGVLADAKTIVTTWRADVPLFASILLGLWVVGVIGAAVWQLAVHWAFLRTVGRRRRITDPNLIALAHEVGEAAGVRQTLCHKLILTAARGIGSPVALGKNEICLPERALTDLEPDELRGVLAHEWAHLVRRDPLWLRICLLMETMFFFQPMVRIGRQQQMEAAEFLCDAWAVRHTGERHALAQSLVRVAAWLRSEPRHIYGPVMASQGSPLGQRVRTLLGETSDVAREVPVGYRIALAGALVLCVAWLVPGVGIENRTAEAAYAQQAGFILPDDDAPRLAVRRYDAQRDLAVLRSDLARLEADAIDAEDLADFEALAELEALASLGELEGLAPMDSLSGLAGLIRSATGLALHGAQLGLTEAQRAIQQEIAELEAEARTTDSHIERRALEETARGLAASSSALTGATTPLPFASRTYDVADGDKLEMSWDEGRSTFTVKVCGPVRFADGGHRIAHMGRGSCIYAHEHQHDADGDHTDSRTLRAEPDPQGLPSYAYEENNRDRTFDSEAAEWLGRTLGELHRRANATMSTGGTARVRSGSGWNRGGNTFPDPPSPPNGVAWVQNAGGSTFEQSGVRTFNWNTGATARSVKLYGEATFDASTGLPLELRGGGAKIVVEENAPGRRKKRVVVRGREGEAPRYDFERGADRAWMQEVMREAMDHGLRGSTNGRFRVAPRVSVTAPQVSVTVPRVQVTPQVRVTPPTPMTWTGRSNGSHGLTTTTGGNRVITSNGDGVERRVVVEGAVTFDEETGTPVRIARGGSVIAEEKTRRSTRKVVITRGRGDALAYEFSGRGANSAWLEDFWCTFKSENEGRHGYDQADAHARVNALLTQGGRNGGTNRVLDAIEDLGGEQQRVSYYLALLGQRLSDADTRRVLHHTDDHLPTDHQKRVLLQYVAQNGPSDAVRAEVLAITDDMDSDFEKRQVLIAVLNKPLDTDGLSRFINTADDIDSDFEKRQVLIALVTNQPTSRFPNSLRARFFGIVSDMDSDFEKRQVALNAIQHFDLEEREVLLAYLAIADAMDSDFEKRQLLQQFARYDVDRDEQVAVLEAIEDVDSDFERATLLRGLSRWYERGDARVQRAYRSAAEGISRSHRQGLPVR